MSALAAWTRAIQATQKAKDLILAGIIDDLAIEHGDRLALVAPKATLTYKNLARRVNRYARWAIAEGLSGKTIGVLMPNSAHYVALWLGLCRAGCQVALLNTNLRADGLRHSLNAAGVTDVIVSDCFLDIIPNEGVTVRRWLGMLAEMTRLSASPLVDVPLPRPTDVALYIYTSGTTGLPKAAKITHRRIIDWSYWFASMTEATIDDRLYDCLPMYHSVGGIVAVGSMLVAGGAVVIRERFSATQFWADIVRERCTIFQYIGELCRYLTLTPACSEEKRHSLRLAVGNGMQADVWQAFQERFKVPRILEFYAATEGNVSLYNCEGEIGSIGRVPRALEPFFGIRLVRVDPDTQEPVRGSDGLCVACGPDEPGEALGLIRDTRKFDGYTDGDATTRKIIRDVAEPGDAWFRTGDLMRRNAAGFFFFVDRLGDTFRWKGENVSASEVANVLRRFPGIQDALVYGVVVDGHDGKAGMAAITTDEKFDLQALPAYLRNRLPGYAHPLFIRLCAGFDLTGTFKPIKARMIRESFVRSSDPVFRLDTLCRVDGLQSEPLVPT